MDIKNKIITDLAEYGTQCYQDGKKVGKAEAIVEALESLRNIRERGLYCLADFCDINDDKRCEDCFCRTIESTLTIQLKKIKGEK